MYISLDFTNSPNLKEKKRHKDWDQNKFSEVLRQISELLKVSWLTVMAPYISKTVTMNEKNAMPSATELSAKKIIQKHYG